MGCYDLWVVLRVGNLYFVDGEIMVENLDLIL